jgi:hypothetical protein
MRHSEGAGGKGRQWRTSASAGRGGVSGQADNGEAVTISPRLRTNHLAQSLLLSCRMVVSAYPRLQFQSVRLVISCLQDADGKWYAICYINLCEVGFLGKRFIEFGDAAVGEASRTLMLRVVLQSKACRMTCCSCMSAPSMSSGLHGCKGHEHAACLSVCNITEICCADVSTIVSFEEPETNVKLLVSFEWLKTRFSLNLMAGKALQHTLLDAHPTLFEPVGQF